MAELMAAITWESLMKSKGKQLSAIPHLERSIAKQAAALRQSEDQEERAALTFWLQEAKAQRAEMLKARDESYRLAGREVFESDSYFGYAQQP